MGRVAVVDVARLLDESEPGRAVAARLEQERGERLRREAPAGEPDARAQEELAVLRAGLVKEVLEGAQEVIAALCEEQGVDVVCASSAVVFAREPPVDITSAVVERLNPAPPPASPEHTGDVDGRATRRDAAPPASEFHVPAWGRIRIRFPHTLMRRTALGILRERWRNLENGNTVVTPGDSQLCKFDQPIVGELVLYGTDFAATDLGRSLRERVGPGRADIVFERLDEDTARSLARR